MDQSDTTVAGFAAAVEPGVAEYREEIAVLKETVAKMNAQLKSEKERADVAAFGKEKLLLVNKYLINEVKVLRTQDLPEEYNSKLLEIRTVIERQKELLGVMCKKHVSKHGEKIKMLLAEKLNTKKEKILASESMEIANLEATEKDSGLCIPGSKCNIGMESTPRSESEDCLLKARASELEEENNNLNDKIASLQKEYDLLQKKHTELNVTHDAIFNGIEKYIEEDKGRAEMKLEDLKKRAELNGERYQTAKRNAINLAYRMKKLEKKYGKALEEWETSKEEFDIERKKFDDVVYHMKKENECLKKNEEDLKEISACLIEDASTARKETEEMKAQCLSKEEVISELEEANLLASKEILKERKLKEEECTAKEECAKQIVKFIVEKGRLDINSKKLRMKKNRLSLHYERVKEDLKNQGRILEKAQESLRDLEEEKYMRRLNKRKGWRKLRFWK